MLWLLETLVLAIVTLVAGVLWMTAVPGRSHAGPLPPLAPEEVELAARLREHVQAIASRPHNIGHPHELERAALHIESTLAGIGYQVHRQPFLAAQASCRNCHPHRLDHPPVTFHFAAPAMSRKAAKKRANILLEGTGVR